MTEESEGKNERKYRELRVQVSHPYITHQHIEKPERPDDKRDEGRDETPKGGRPCD